MGGSPTSFCAEPLRHPRRLHIYDAPVSKVEQDAGEHASNYPSWMNGALESGAAAAKAVDEAASREAAA